VLGQLWLFWLAPLVGAALAGLVYRGFAVSPTAGTAAAAGEEETDQEKALLAEAGEEPGPDAQVPTAAAPAPAGRTTGEDEARDFFDKRGQ